MAQEVLQPQVAVAMAEVRPLPPDRCANTDGSTAKRRRLLKNVYVRIKRKVMKKIPLDGVGSIAREELELEEEITKGFYDNEDDVPECTKKRIKRNNLLNDVPKKFISKQIRKENNSRKYQKNKEETRK